MKTIIANVGPLKRGWPTFDMIGDLVSKETVSCVGEKVKH